MQGCGRRQHLPTKYQAQFKPQYCKNKQKEKENAKS
jgi:hypothetical protein